MNVFDVAVNGVPLVFVVMGLVEFIKRRGVTGNALSYVSMGLGLVLGGGYQISQIGVPTSFSTWFGVGIFGIGYGLVASGIYDVGDAMVDRAVTQLLEKLK